MMEITQAGVEMIKRFELFEPNLYNDKAGHCTIGYGHLVHRGPIDGRLEELPFVGGITEEEATQLLKSDIALRAEGVVRSEVKVSLSQNEFDALVSFVFNIGGHNFAESTFLRKLNAGDRSGAAKEMLRWVYAGGEKLNDLYFRRRKEVSLFSGAPLAGDDIERV